MAGHSVDYPLTLTSSATPSAALNQLSTESHKTESQKDDPKLREAFDNFVGETFYGQMLKSMRSTIGKPAYFHGGRAEEVFQSQLDQKIVEEMTHASANEFTDSMYHLFMLRRS